MVATASTGGQSPFSTTFILLAMLAVFGVVWHGGQSLSSEVVGRGVETKKFIAVVGRQKKQVNVLSPVPPKAAESALPSAG